MKRILSAIVLAGLCLSASPVCAETATAPATPSLAELVAVLGTPARRKAVDTALAGIRTRGPDYGRVLARALGHAGGPEAAEGLVDLLRLRSADVHAAVFEAAGSLRLRHAGLVAKAVDAAQSGEAAVRESAFVALSHIGDGEHVPVMIRGLGDKHAGVRYTALLALRRLTRVNAGASAAGWWRWWKRFQKRSTQDLRTALEVISSKPSGPSLAPGLDVVRRYAWVDLAYVRGTARELLRNSDAALQVRGCFLAESLQLADLAQDVRSLYRYTSSKTVLAAARSCAKALRIPLRRERSAR